MHTTDAFGHARVGVLSTVRPDGGSHVVPVVFAVIDNMIVTAVDHKPKTTTNLQRISNIRSNPHVSLLVHHYDEDWNALWWVRADGQAEVIEHGPAHSSAVDALVAKYDQYHNRPPSGPVIVIAVDHVAHWGDVAAAE